MVERVQLACPGVLASHFTNVCDYGCLPPQWKLAVCVPMLIPGRTDRSIRKNLGPISLLSCLGKAFEKVLTARLMKAASLTGASPAEHMGCLPSRSTIDTLMMTLTPVQSWTRQRTGRNQSSVGPIFLTNDIEEACNCVAQERLTKIVRHVKLPKHLVQILDSFQRGDQLPSGSIGNTRNLKTSGQAYRRAPRCGQSCS